MFFLTIGTYLVTFNLIKKKIGAGANFGEGGPEKQLFFFYHGLSSDMITAILAVLR